MKIKNSSVKAKTANLKNPSITQRGKFIVQGGQPLAGEIQLAGSKNAATKMLVASLLTEEECVLENFPEIGDTETVKELCRSLGSQINEKGSFLKIKTPKIENVESFALRYRNRIPILTLGPLLARVGEAKVPIVGGDKIGSRPVDFHLKALESLGAVITIEKDYYRATAPYGLHGANIIFAYPSVGATENAVLAAVLAKGKTFIRGAAVEPELIDLIKMLQKMGAIIELGANRQIYISGVEKLSGVHHWVIPDRNEAVSFACLALASGGNILIKDAIQDHLITFLNEVRRCGGNYEVKEEGIRFWRSKELAGLELETDTHPGFMTDWQQPMIIVLTQAQGISVIHETVYEDRFGYTKDLNLMGARITVFSKCLGELPCRFKNRGFPHSAVVDGKTPLKGTKIKVPDLRAGIAHLIAALIAEGESIIEGIEEIDRGYEKIDERLKNLGADILRIKGN